jgi:peptide-methionine (S)-S-oxide reductase
MLGIGAYKQRLPLPQDALPGRATETPLRNVHHVLGRPLRAAFDGMQRVQFAMGCFWGAERKFWSLPGVVTTAVGYSGGYTPNPTYREVCSGETGHTEAVLVVHDPAQVSFDALLKIFWESHDPTQGMRQGNDAGTQYRSAIHCSTQAQFDAGAVAHAFDARGPRIQHHPEQAVLRHGGIGLHPLGVLHAEAIGGELRQRGTGLFRCGVGGGRRLRRQQHEGHATGQCQS